MKLNKIILLSGFMAFTGLWTGCSEDINNYEKTTPAEANNKVFFSEKNVEVVYNAFRDVNGEVTNLDTLVAKLVVNCSEPAASDLKIKVNLDTLMVSAFNKHHETSYRQMAGYIKVNRNTLTIPEGATESADTLVVALTIPLSSKELDNTDGYMVPVSITSASGYDAQVDYDKRISYVTLNVTQENGVGFAEGKTEAAVTAAAAQAGYEFPIMAFAKSDKDVNIELKVDNGLVADFNSRYHTDFKTLADGTYTLPAVTMTAGTTSCNGSISFGEGALSGGNYLIPIKVNAASEVGNTVKILANDTYYLMVNGATGASLVTEADLGTKQTDRSAYKIVSSTSGLSFNKGSFADMFKDNADFWVLGKAYTPDIVIDLGAEYKNITGILFEASAKSMLVKELSVSYAGEALYADYPARAVFVGAVVPTVAASYIKFEQPVTARYITLNHMEAAKTYYTGKNFFIYTQE